MLELIKKQAWFGHLQRRRSEHSEGCSFMFLTFLVEFTVTNRKLIYARKNSALSQCLQSILGCPTTYSCHVDSVLLNSKFKVNRSKY